MTQVDLWPHKWDRVSQAKMTYMDILSDRGEFVPYDPKWPQVDLWPNKWAAPDFFLSEGIEGKMRFCGGKIQRFAKNGWFFAIFFFWLGE